jgi:hypothetical protein
MVKSSSQKVRINKDPYWKGVLSGVFLSCFFISIAISLFIKYQGLQFAINPKQLAKLVQAEVQIEAGKDIPQILERIKRDLPNELPNHLNQLEELTIGLGNSQIRLPPELLAAIESEFNRIFETAIINTVNSYNTLAYEELIGEKVYKTVERTIRQELIGKTYFIRYSQWFSVPVKIVASNTKLYLQKH